MPFGEWNDVSKSHLELPIQGVIYRVPPIGYLDEIRIRASQRAAADLMLLTSEDEADPEKVAELQAGIMPNEGFLRACLGPALQQMRDANVPTDAIIHAATVSHTAVVQGRDVAERLWEDGLDPEELAAQMAALRDVLTKLAPGSTTSTGTASETETRSPASTTPTNSPKGTPRKRPARKAAGSSTSTKSSKTTPC